MSRGGAPRSQPEVGGAVMVREGPLVTVKRSCNGCKHEFSESYRIQGDSGFDVSCRQPEVNEGALRRIGDTDWNTPKWCPYLKEQP